MGRDVKTFMGFSIFYLSYLFILNTFAFIDAGISLISPNVQGVEAGLFRKLFGTVGFGTFGSDSPIILTLFSAFMFVSWVVLLLSIVFGD